MVRSAIVAFVYLASSVQVAAQDEDPWIFASGTNGSRLMALCGNDWSFGKYDPCGSYITGVIDGLGASGKLCPPSADVATHQMSAVAFNAVKTQPERWHWPASVLISEALIKNFGCSKIR